LLTPVTLTLLITSIAMEMMFRVNDYKFGEIVVEGKVYSKDLILLPGRIVENWWRREGHELCLDDLKEVLKEDIEVLVVGTGYYGFMKILPEVERELKKQNIRLIACPTGEAYKVYNDLVENGKRVAGAFHLTC